MLWVLISVGTYMMPALLFVTPDMIGGAWGRTRSRMKGEGNCPGGPVVKTLESVLPLQGAQGPSLVGELRSHMLRGEAKKKERMKGELGSQRV